MFFQLDTCTHPSKLCNTKSQHPGTVDGISPVVAGRITVVQEGIQRLAGAIVTRDILAVPQLVKSQVTQAGTSQSLRQMGKLTESVICF